MKRTLLTALLFTTFVSTHAFAARPSITSLQQQINELNARMITLESRTDSLEATTLEFGEILSQFTEVCGGDKTLGYGGALPAFEVTMPWMQNPTTDWDSLFGGDSTSVTVDGNVFYCVSDVVLDRRLVNPSSLSVELEPFPNRLTLTQGEIFRLLPGDFVVNKVQDVRTGRPRIVPGSIEIGDIVLEIHADNPASGNLYTWWENAVAGDVQLINVTIALSETIPPAGAGNPGTTWINQFQYRDCRPTGWGLLQSDSGDPLERTTISCLSVEFGTGNSDEQIQFIFGWLNDVQGNQEIGLQDVGIKLRIESEGETPIETVYRNAFPTRYVFPSFPSVDAVRQQFHFRPESMQLQ